jgi:DNA-binding CsgD family transcriptional regulator
VTAAELAELQRLIRREKELLAEVERLTKANAELAAAADASRNFKASHAAGYIDLDLDSWRAP